MSRIATGFGVSISSMGEGTLTRESIIEAARAVVKDRDGAPCFGDFVRLTGIGGTTSGTPFQPNNKSQ
jgi:hypothetical protein